MNVRRTYRALFTGIVLLPFLHATLVLPVSIAFCASSGSSACACACCCDGNGPAPATTAAVRGVPCCVVTAAPMAPERSLTAYKEHCSDSFKPLGVLHQTSMSDPCDSPHRVTTILSAPPGFCSGDDIPVVLATLRL